MEVGGVGAWEYDPDGGHLTTSAACKAMFGARQTRSPHMGASRRGLSTEHSKRLVDASKEGARRVRRVRARPRGDLAGRQPAPRPDPRTRVRSAMAPRASSASARMLPQRGRQRRSSELLLHELNHRVKKHTGHRSGHGNHDLPPALRPRRGARDIRRPHPRQWPKTHDLLTATSWERAALPRPALCRARALPRPARQAGPPARKPVMLGTKASWPWGSPSTSSRRMRRSTVALSVLRKGGSRSGGARCGLRASCTFLSSGRRATARRSRRPRVRGSARA